jgi:hypothetical protein
VIVPMMSNTPIAASRPAPCTWVNPWSAQAAMRCVPMRPLVVAPQTKNANTSSWKSRRRANSPSVVRALRNGFATRGAGGAGSVAP